MADQNQPESELPKKSVEKFFGPDAEKGEPVNIHVPIQIDRRELAKEVLRETPEILRQYGVTGDMVGIKPLTPDEEAELRRKLAEPDREERSWWWIAAGAWLCGCTVGAAIGATLAGGWPW